MGSIYFISDVHLGAGTFDQEREKRDKLIAFLQQLPGRADRLYIVGDLFDFWFEYRSAILKQHFSVLFELNNLVRQGVPVVYMAGNHDFWLGSFLTEQLGLETVYGSITVELQGKRLFLCHGDGMINQDRGYRLLKKVLRNPFCLWLFQLIHPDIGVSMGRLISRLSRKHGAPTTWDPRPAYRELALSLLEKKPYDAVVFGHVHQSDFQEWDGKAYLNLGDWIKQYSYGRLAHGVLSLERFDSHSQIC